ncbi:hypothetical protein J2S28_005554 [Rhizobium sp. SLBN-94]|nr:hypothetical protein [Rhizobium sp. SLBN-94]
MNRAGTTIVSNRAAFPPGLLRPAPGRNLTDALARVSNFVSHRVISVTL